MLDLAAGRIITPFVHDPIASERAFALLLPLFSRKLSQMRSIFLLSAAACAVLSGCGHSENLGGESSRTSTSAAGGTGGVHSPTNPSASHDSASVTAAGFNLADGPDVCFRAIAKHLGPDVKVSEITSFFSAGSEIDSDTTEPQGTMTICKVDYQNPDDHRKLLSASLDPKSGAFGKPQPVEITVMGGNAATFNIEDYLIPLSKVNAAALTSIMDAQKPKLTSVYSKYAWSGVRLEAPGAFSNKHTLRLDVEGRLASNDIKEDGYASVTPDGKMVTINYLVP